MKLLSVSLGTSLAIFIISIAFVKSASASYESQYGDASFAVVKSPHISPAVAPVSSGQGWGSGQSAGSYYHYHVPLVGQQSHHYSPQPQQTTSPDIHHQLLWIIPLLLLLLAPALLLPLLLKFLLLPIGLSLLGLLLPLLMMGMMMMMMMMGDDMMMPMRHRRPPLTRVTSARELGQLLLNDWTSIFTMASRSFDVDNCPEKLVCTLGGFIFSQNGSSVEDLAKKEIMSNYIVEQLIPRGRMRKLLRTYKDAFWTGSKSRDCVAFTCQPSLHLFENNQKKNGTESFNHSTDFEKQSHSNTNESENRASHFKSRQLPLTRRTGSNNIVAPTAPVLKSKN